MSNKPIQYPIDTRNKERYPSKKTSSNLPTINNMPMLNTNTCKSIFNIGKDGNRSMMGTVTRKVYMKNANGEVMVITDTQDFINTAEGMKARMGNRRPRNKPRKKQFGNW